MESESYRWHYDYTRLAWESGFCFENHKSKKAYDRNAIAVIDIERIIRERDIAIVEKYVDNILEYNLDADEMRILDPNFVKLFRLGQLSIEFLIYCKKYLDKTIVVLKTDLKKKIEENEYMKNEISKTQSENYKLKKRLKDLKITLHCQQKFQLSTNSNDSVTVFQCHVCGKAFINNEFLNAHLKRRHNITDDKILDNITDKLSPDSTDHNVNSSTENEQLKTETDRLQLEIKELKEKLNNAERYFIPQQLNSNVCLSPEHGTVKIQTISQHTECYNDILGLRHQFELLKTQVDAELNLFKTQKFEHDKYDEWIQKVFSKIGPQTGTIDREIETKEVMSIERRNSYTQTDESIDVDIEKGDKIPRPTKSESLLVESRHNSPVKITVGSPQIRPSIQKIKDGTSHFIKVIDSPIKTNTSVPDHQTVQEEVGKKLEEKTKQEIEYLGEQLNEKMSNTFYKLEERMESFWNKLNEIQTRNIAETPSLVPQQLETRLSPQSAQSTLQKQENTYNENPNKIIIEKYPSRNFETSTSESDGDSGTESNQIPPSDTEVLENEAVPTPSKNINHKHLMTNLKTKAQETKNITKIISNVPKIVENMEQSKKNVISKPLKYEKDIEAVIQREPMLHTSELKTFVQNPVVKKVFSQPLKYSTSESETENTSESETESSIQSDIKPSKPKNKTLLDSSKTKKSEILTSQKQLNKRLDSESANVENLEEVREEIIDAVSKRLKDLGVDPSWKSLPNKVFKQKTETTAHQRSLAIKRNNSIHSIRQGILEDLELKVKTLSKSSLKEYHPEIEQKSSKLKSLLTSMKSKAKLLLKSETKVPFKSTPIYRLTVHHDLPEQNIEKKTMPGLTPKKGKIPVKKGKIIIKPKKLSTDSEDESEIDKSSEINKQRKIQTKNADIVLISSRKSMSTTSLNTDEKSFTKTIPVQNIAKSLSNLDSILELKKEIIAEINNEEQQNQKQSSKNSSESSEVSISENVLTKSQQKSISSLKNPKKIMEQANTKLEHDEDYSETDSEEIKREKMQKSVLKNYPSTSSLVKKKVLFDLESESIKTVSEANTNIIQAEPSKKTFVKSNSFFNFDKDDDSTSVTSSVFDGSKSNLNQALKEKISTKAIINVPAKRTKKQDEESDWDISDIIN